MTSGIEALHIRHDDEMELMENTRQIIHKWARAQQHFAQELTKIQAIMKTPKPEYLREEQGIGTIFQVSVTAF